MQWQLKFPYIFYCIACENRTHGYDCMEECGYCVGTVNCDPKTGYCPGGKCEGVYTGPDCKKCEYIVAVYETCLQKCKHWWHTRYRDYNVFSGQMSRKFKMIYLSY